MTLVAVVSGLALVWFLYTAVKADRVQQDLMRAYRNQVWERRDYYADTPQGREDASFQQWAREMGR